MLTIHEEHIRQAFLDATILTFKRMLFVDINQTDTSCDLNFDISAVIGFSGIISGNAAIRFPYTAIKAVTEQTIGNSDIMESDIADCAGELINIITGNAKAAITQVSLQLSFPEVIKGLDHSIDFKNYSNIFKQTFESDLGQFEITVAYAMDSQDIRLK